MSLAEEFNTEINKIETTFPRGLSNTSTRKFDVLIGVVSRIFELDQDDVYITAATSRASNLWNRLAQGKPLSRHYKFALCLISDENLQGGLSPVLKFIGAGNTHYDAIAVGVKRDDKWTIGAVVDTDGLRVYDKAKNVFAGSEIEYLSAEDNQKDSFAWYVGATCYENGKWKDYTEEFIEKGIWQNRGDEFFDIVNSIKKDDRIVIKSCFTQKNGLPFDNNGKTVCVMAIKAIGSVVENENDGKTIRVNWKRLDPIKKWYGQGALRQTIHKVDAREGFFKEQVLNFTFSNIQQDYSICEDYYGDGTLDGDENIFDLDAIKIDEVNRRAQGRNILLYGVPGSGKSWTIEHEYCHPDSIVERLVFYPDYTNADFVGQILPTVDKEKQVSYEFSPGPFTRIMHEAYLNPEKEYILVIEEINRGNAPAIFGDIFQLLDRSAYKRTIDGVEYLPGTSEYFISNADIAEIVYGDKSHKVRIPSNLSIVGTMNTSDQNVYTLDTAFQRRWKMRLIENSFENVDPSFANAIILDTDITWRRFCETINTLIIGNRNKMVSAEDKRLGVYFAQKDDFRFDNRAIPTEGFETIKAEYFCLLSRESSGEITDVEKERLIGIREALIQNRAFPEKVLKYLWDDAFKFNPEALFDVSVMDSLEKVIKTFVYSNGSERFRVFNQKVFENLYSEQQ